MYYNTAEALAASGEFSDDMTISEVVEDDLPFNGGRSKLLLLPRLMPFHFPNSFPSSMVQVNAPIHGCTFHPTPNVTLLRSEMIPLISVIWYFGFEFLRRMIPGSGFDTSFLLNVFFFARACFSDPIFRKHSMAYNRGLNGCDWLCELMMVSHITAWERGVLGEGFEEGYVAVIQTNNCFVFQLKSDVKSSSGQRDRMWSIDVRLTSFKVKLYMCIFLFLSRVIMWSTLNPEQDEIIKAYTSVMGSLDVHLQIA